MGNIQKMCGRAAWLSHGEIVQVGPAEDVVKQFQIFMEVEAV
jgi:ABC-type polysaccharide/polyol phosphate transport system ATPase subunit